MEQDSGEKASDISISQKNYKFKYKKLIQSENRPVYVYELTPREKKVGLFKGELWIDSETYMPVRESGRLVKSPSVFLKKVEFVREYVIKDGIAVPKMIRSLIETRLAGKAELDINYSNYTREGSAAEAEAAALNDPSIPTPVVRN